MWVWSRRTWLSNLGAEPDPDWEGNYYEVVGATVDTGATICMMGDLLAGKLGLELTDPTALDPSTIAGVTTTAGHEEVAITKWATARIKVGEVCYDQRVAVVNLAAFRWRILLGVNFLNRHRVTIDF